MLSEGNSATENVYTLREGEFLFGPTCSYANFWKAF